ncbi:MAG: hypothetical protein RL472_1429, partial [Pseudomonadota bacterium]
MTMPRDSAFETSQAEIDALSDAALLVLYGRGDSDAARVLTGRHLGRV